MAATMKRHVSNSCLISPNSPTKNNSVTILNAVQLPRYSSERYFLLSELEVHASPTRFLCETLPDTATQTTDDTAAESVEEHEAPSFPLFIVVYLFWRPDDHDKPEQFTQTLVGTVNALRDQVDIKSSGSDNLKDRVASLSEASSSKEQPSQKPTTSLYLVVDRQGTDTELAEQLARTAASHPVLRQYTEGITVGLANHQRAAPGLEAIVEAVLVGNRDRRSVSSLLGVVSPHPDHLLGLQEFHTTDAAQGVQQTLITAEWNGRGNLQTYAHRAHAVWRMQHNLPPLRTVPVKRKVPRRIRPDKVMTGLPHNFLEDCFLDGLACLVVCVYMVFHFGRPLVEYLDQTSPST